MAKFTGAQREVANRLQEGELLTPDLLRAYDELLDTEHLRFTGVRHELSDELYAQTEQAWREFDALIYEGNGD